MPAPRTPTPSDFDQAVLDARVKWADEEAVTVADVEDAYDRAIQRVQQRLAQTPTTWPVTRSWRSEISDDLVLTRTALSQESLTAIRNGTLRAHKTGADTSLPEQRFLAQVTDDPFAVDAVYRTTNEQAALSYLSRVKPNGLTLSDAVWQSTDPFHRAMTDLIGSAVISGESARDVSRALEGYLRPGVASPSSEAVRRNLGLPRNLSYQTIRLARTEINTAGREGSINSHGQSPFYLGVAWNISRVHDVPDICDDLADGPVVHTDGTRYWPVGSEPASSHPNCRCYVTPVYQDEETMLAELEKWVEDPTDPSLDPKLNEWNAKLEQANVLGTRPPEAPPPEPRVVQQRPREAPVQQEPIPMHKRSGSEVRQALLTEEDAYNAERQRLTQEVENKRAAQRAAFDNYQWANKQYGFQSKESEVLFEDYKRVYDEWLTAQKDAQAAKEQLIDDLRRRYLYTPGGPAEVNPNYKTVRGRTMKPSEVPPSWKKGNDIWAKMAGKGTTDAARTKDLPYETMKKSDDWFKSRRSYHSQGKITMHPEDKGYGTPVHENWHWLEHNSTELNRRIEQEIRRRTQGEQLQSLRKVTGHNYRADEVAYVDKFFNPYMGRESNMWGHEFLATAAEEMATNPFEFARKDPESFDFVVDLLHDMRDGFPGEPTPTLPRRDHQPAPGVKMPRYLHPQAPLGPGGQKDAPMVQLPLLKQPPVEGAKPPTPPSPLKTTEPVAPTTKPTTPPPKPPPEPPRPPPAPSRPAAPIRLSEEDEDAWEAATTTKISAADDLLKEQLAALVERRPPPEQDIVSYFGDYMKLDWETRDRVIEHMLTKTGGIIDMDLLGGVIEESTAEELAATLEAREGAGGFKVVYEVTVPAGERAAVLDEGAASRTVLPQGARIEATSDVEASQGLLKIRGKLVPPDYIAPAEELIPRPPAYTAAKNIEEAERFSKGLGVKFVHAEARDLKVLNEANRQLYEVTQANPTFSPPRSISVESMSDQGIVAQYNHGGEILQLNRNNDAWARMADDALDMQRAGYWSDGDPNHVVLHELAHRQHALTYSAKGLPGGYWDLTWDASDAVAKDRVRAEVSRYAADSPDEFVAEAYTAMTNGRRYSPEVMRLYRKYNGPVIEGVAESAEEPLAVTA